MPSLRPNLTATIHHEVYPALSLDGSLKGAAENKSVIVTGAGRGIGKEIAIAFARAGARAVVLVARSSSEIEAVATELKHINTNIIAYPHTADLTDRQSVELLMKEATAKVGAADILVANAGYLEKPAPVAEADLDDWWSTYEINNKGLYLTVGAFLRSRKDKKVTVICTSSIGSYAYTRGLWSYQSGKTAVNRFVEHLQGDYDDEGIRAFAFHPGGVTTKLAENVPSHMRHDLRDNPKLAGAFAVYLCSPRADFLKGRYSSALWDVDEMEALKDKIIEKDLLKTKVILS